MLQQSIVRKRPNSLNGNDLHLKVGEEERICTDCKLPKKKCNGDCKRYKEEMKKIKEKQKQEGKKL